MYLDMFQCVEHANLSNYFEPEEVAFFYIKSSFLR
jgi:hypothetical protein